MSAVKAVGLDFGTTNSAVAAIAGDGSIRLARFPAAERAMAETMRSILFFSADPHEDDPIPWAGAEAIAHYIASGANGRLIQSLKSFLADRLFRETTIEGDTYSLEDLIAPITRRLRAEAEAQFGELPERVVVGRPVHFSSARDESDEALAQARLEVAIRRAGWKQIAFEFEPVAAAYHYAATLEREELILVADFGGGTSDFSIVRLDPRSGARTRHEILANDGVAVAGDAFDGEIVRHAVTAELGRGSSYRTPYGQVLPMPTKFYSQMERWHFLSFLKAPATMHRLRELERQSLQPEKVRALIHIVEDDLGYFLFKSVEQAKLDLSAAESTALRFSDPPVRIEKPLGRAEFEHWIARELREIAGCVDRVMKSAEVLPDSIDAVFLTGGSSFVPAVRRIFAERFGDRKIRSGSEFTSIARGLALRALDLSE